MINRPRPDTQPLTAELTREWLDRRAPLILGLGLFATIASIFPAQPSARQQAGGAEVAARAVELAIGAVDASGFVLEEAATIRLEPERDYLIGDPLYMSPDLAIQANCLTDDR